MQRKKAIFTACFFAVIMLMSSCNNHVAMAQSENDYAAINQTERTLSPYFVVYSNDKSTDALPLKETTADVNIAGIIADVTVR